VSQIHSQLDVPDSAEQKQEQASNQRFLNAAGLAFRRAALAGIRDSAEMPALPAELLVLPLSVLLDVG
jgi:hypothetical protein